MMSSPLPQLNQMTDILDLKDIRLWDLRWVWIFAACILLMVLLLVVRAWWRGRKNRQEPLPPPKTPLQAALDALEELVNSRLVETGQIQRFYFKLSEIFREFIEQDLGLAALETTVEELRPQLKTYPDFQNGEAQEAIWLLELADMAKFAKQIPDREELIKSVKICRLWMTRMAERKEMKRQAQLISKEVNA